jgi:hypothetical protein
MKDGAERPKKEKPQKGSKNRMGYAIQFDRTARNKARRIARGKRRIERNAAMRESGLTF